MRQGVEAQRSGADGGWKAREFANKKPHIVLAVLDDVGFGDLGCYGAGHRTDYIDTLADSTRTKRNRQSAKLKKSVRQP